MERNSVTNSFEEDTFEKARTNNFVGWKNLIST